MSLNTTSMTGTIGTAAENNLIGGNEFASVLSDMVSKWGELDSITITALAATAGVERTNLHQPNSNIHVESNLSMIISAICTKPADNRAAFIAIFRSFHPAPTGTISGLEPTPSTPVPGSLPAAAAAANSAPICGYAQKIKTTASTQSVIFIARRTFEILLCTHPSASNLAYKKTFVVSTGHTLLLSRDDDCNWSFNGAAGLATIPMRLAADKRIVLEDLKAWKLRSTDHTDPTPPLTWTFEVLSQALKELSDKAVEMAKESNISLIDTRLADLELFPSSTPAITATTARQMSPLVGFKQLPGEAVITTETTIFISRRAWKYVSKSSKIPYTKRVIKRDAYFIASNGMRLYMNASFHWEFRTSSRSIFFSPDVIDQRIVLETDTLAREGWKRRDKNLFSFEAVSQALKELAEAVKAAKKTRIEASKAPKAKVDAKILEGLTLH